MQESSKKKRKSEARKQKNKEDLDFDEQKERFEDDEECDKAYTASAKEIYEDSDDDLFNPGTTKIRTEKGRSFLTDF